MVSGYNNKRAQHELKIRFLSHFVLLRLCLLALSARATDAVVVVIVWLGPGLGLARVWLWLCLWAWSDSVLHWLMYS